MFILSGAAERVEHRFNRRYGVGRRDVYLLRTDTGWQVLGRDVGADGREVVHHLHDEATARAMLQRMLAAVPPELSNRSKIVQHPRHPGTQRQDRR
jgi:hypothetical protein